ncbi:MAG: GNAT family N-acetyltransferase [Pseudomonadota bacterium]
MTKTVLPLSERIAFRVPDLSAYDDLVRLRGDAEVMKFVSGSPQDAEAVWYRLLRSMGHWEAFGYGYWMLHDRGTNAFLGEAGIAHFRRLIVPPLPDVPEAGWMLLPSAWGRGLATEAMRAIIAWADDHVDYQEMVSIYAPEHTASIRVGEKCGFQFERKALYREDEITVMRRSRGATGGSA